MQASKTSSTPHEDSTMTDTDPRMPTILRRPQVERRSAGTRRTVNATREGTDAQPV
jgi:hypothetical protein